jgi:putative ABC transport system permease protein
MVALGEGAQRQVESQLATLGTNVLTVRPGQEMFGGIDRGENRMTQDDAAALLDSARTIRAASPEMQRRQQIAFEGANSNSSVVGVWPSYFEIQNFRIARGRIFTVGEERGRRRVAVVGARFGERLNIPTEALLNRVIRIRGIPFEVIGIFEEKGEQGWMNPDESVYVPLSTAQFRLFGTDRVSSIYVQATSEQAMDPAVAEIDARLRRAHRLNPGEPSDFTVRNQTALLSTFQEATQTFTFLLAGIAAISLLVGGIGIMNIMLVSVTERTREIGVRKALGAKRRDIMLQFLVEALVLCLAGGALGIALGVGSARTLQSLADWNVAVSPEAVLVAFGFAGVVGVFFGLWPARRAASLDPIIALRYE